MNELTAWAQRWLDILGPNHYAQAAAALVVILAVAKTLDLLAQVLLKRLVRPWAGAGAERLASALHRPVLVTVVLMGLMVITALLELEGAVGRITLGILQTLLALTWIVFTMTFFSRVLELFGQRVPQPGFAQPNVAALLRTFLFVALFLVATYTLLTIWGVSVTGLLASAGIVGLALSFAAQDTLANLFAGIAILMDRPYAIGDYIVLDTGERGAVTHVGLRSTRLLTRDDVEVSIPNSIMGKAKIVNESGGPYSRYRVRVPVRVAYGSDIDQVMDLLLRIAKAHEEVEAQPEARLRLRVLGESCLEFELLCWINDPAQRGLVVHELNCAIYKAFAEAGIAVPFPQREVHLHEA
jgi:MscS family membrane protein